MPASSSSVLQVEMIQLLKFALSISVFFLYTRLVVRAQEEEILTNCPPEGQSYSSGSQYEINLKALLPALVSNAVIKIDAHYNTSVGGGLDRIYGYAQCMSASKASTCRTCLNKSITDLGRLCPERKQATIRYYSCIIRYSSVRFFSNYDDRRLVHGQMYHGDVTEPVVFSQHLGALMKNLSKEAAANSSRLAWGRRGYNKLSDIYGLAQCTGDLSPDVCCSCLEELTALILSRCQDSTSCSLYYPSCNIRYETRPFDPASRLRSPPAVVAFPINGDGSNKRGTVIVAAVCAVTATLAAVTTIGIFLSRRKKKLKKLSVYGHEEEIRRTESLMFDLGTLRVATNNFSDTNKLGHGGFGPVYKGKLPDGQEIAVKRLLTSSSQGMAELRNEVVLAAKLQHRNLVRLLGCCNEEQEKLLIYEYVPNISLDKFLFDPTSRAQLYWETRYKIIGGIARGLLYLHEDSRLRVVHRDLKASNILLDKAMNPQISDFGLAKLLGGDETQGNTARIAGTYGYMAPEYAMRGQFSAKSDVYSFGVLVLEIVTGRKNSSFSESESSANLLSCIWRHWNEGTALELVDQSVGKEYPRDEVLRCIHLGLLCVQADPRRRPLMSTVLVMLNSRSIPLPDPSKPANFFGIRRTLAMLTRNSASWLSGESQSTHKATPISVNEMSISELAPR